MSVEKESTTTTSSHQRRDSTQSAMFLSSFNVVMTAEIRARGGELVARSDIKTSIVSMLHGCNKGRPDLRRGAPGRMRYMQLTMASPKPEQDTSVAPSIWRCRS